MRLILLLLGLALFAPVAACGLVGIAIAALFTAVLGILAFPGAVCIALSEELERQR